MKNIPEFIDRHIIRFLQKEASEQDLQTLEAWLAAHEDNKRYFDEMNEAFQTSQVLSSFTHEKVNLAWARVNSQIKSSPKAPARTKVIKLYHYNILRIAATVSAIVLLSYVAWTQFAKTTPDARTTIVYRASQRNTKVFLPDGTAVWLNANSTLFYGPDFGVSNREVFLKGEAFFDVSKDEHKKFIVNAEAFTIQVKGTRFNVRAYTNEENIRTTLEEGSVDLSVKGVIDTEEHYAMKPGDQISFNAQQRVVTRQTVNPSDYTAWKEEQLIFDNTRLADIILKLENRYKIHILINDSLARREHLTMTIGSESLDEVLEFIQVSSRLKYRKENTNIYIFE